jgi:SAM-dependent methyltransferase
MNDPYATDAAWYDLLHADYDEDLGLWLSFAGRSERPLLEVGCGTGRVAIPLARAGHQVTGIDASAAMLAKARERAGAAIHRLALHEGSPTELDLPADHFGFVLAANDVFLYCRDGDEQVECLRALARAMHFNAVLAIDVPGPAMHLDPTTNGQPLLAFDGTDDDGQRLIVWHLREDDLALQTRRLHIVYELTGKDGAVRRQHSEHHLRYVHRFELEYLLRVAGLVQLDVYGDYDLGPLTSSSERMIVTAQRTEG